MKIPHVLGLSFAALALSANAATPIPILGVFGHNEKINQTAQGTITDMINGSGMNGNDKDGSVTWPVGEGDPSTWTFSDPYPNPSYGAEWQSQDLLDAGENPTNGKIGWTIFDFGSSVSSLENLYLFPNRENATKIAATYNVYLGTATVSTPSHGPTNGTSIDYDFSTSGWTLVNASVLTGTFGVTDVVSLGGNTARYVGIEILSNGGSATNTGFQEVGITAIPEPSAALLGALGFLALLRRRR